MTQTVHSKRLARELAMQFLFQCDITKEPPTDEKWDDFLLQAQDELGLQQDRFTAKAAKYARHLYEGVTLHQEEIDGTIGKFSENWDFSRLGIVDRNILRIAIFEMLNESSVPPVVSINEAVEIARDYSGAKSGNFINGVLNGIKNTLSRPAREAVSHL